MSFEQTCNRLGQLPPALPQDLVSDALPPHGVQSLAVRTFGAMGVEVLNSSFRRTLFLHGQSDITLHAARGDKTMSELVRDFSCRDKYGLQRLLKRLDDGLRPASTSHHPQQGAARRSRVAVDVGSNLGDVAIALYKKDPSLRILALEPMPNKFTFLRWNLMSNHVPLLHEDAFLNDGGEGDSEPARGHGGGHRGGIGGGVLALNMAATSDGRNVSVAYPRSSLGAADAAETHTMVRMVRSLNLASWLARKRVRQLDVLKIDCAGCEDELVASLDAPLLQRTIVFEGELRACSDRHADRVWHLAAAAGLDTCVDLKGSGWCGTRREHCGLSDNVSMYVQVRCNSTCGCKPPNPRMLDDGCHQHERTLSKLCEAFPTADESRSLHVPASRCRRQTTHADAPHEPAIGGPIPNSLRAFQLAHQPPRESRRSVASSPARGTHSTDPPAPTARTNASRRPMTQTRESKPRIAFQLSGHLQQLCSTAPNFSDRMKTRWDELDALLRDCRAVAICDVFIATWSTLRPALAKPVQQPDAAPEVRRFGVHELYTNESSAECLRTLVERLQVTATHVAEQPIDLMARFGSGKLVRRYPGTTLNSPMRTNISLAWDAPLAGIRASVYAMRMASTLRREFCAAFGCAHDFVIRMRPDLYDEGSFARDSLTQKRRPSARYAWLWYAGGTFVRDCNAFQAMSSLSQWPSPAHPHLYGCHDRFRPGEKNQVHNWDRTSRLTMYPLV